MAHADAKICAREKGSKGYIFSMHRRRFRRFLFKYRVCREAALNYIYTGMGIEENSWPQFSRHYSWDNGEFKTAKWLVMLAGRISIIGSYLWIQPIMLNCSASRPSRFVDLNMSIFERIRSVRARAAIDVSIDVLSMYGNLYGHEWYINKNNVTSILLVNSITLIILFISYIVNTCTGINIFNTKILTYEMKYPFYFSAHTQTQLHKHVMLCTFHSYTIL